MTMRKVFTVAVSLAVAGCAQPSDKGKSEPAPIGRFQIVNDTKNDGVFWVDTRYGTVEQCMWVENTNQWKCFTVKQGVLVD